MKRRKSPITDIFDLFIYYKIFELAISIIIGITAYKLFPKPFNFFFNVILQNL